MCNKYDYKKCASSKDLYDGENQIKIIFLNKFPKIKSQKMKLENRGLINWI